MTYLYGQYHRVIRYERRETGSSSVILRERDDRLRTTGDHHPRTRLVTYVNRSFGWIALESSMSVPSSR